VTSAIAPSAGEAIKKASVLLMIVSPPIVNSTVRSEGRRVLTSKIASW